MDVLDVIIEHVIDKVPLDNAHNISSTVKYHINYPYQLKEHPAPPVLAECLISDPLNMKTNQ